ncbi:MAG TPA: hypothetical protein VJQ82_14680 [Terriglobales bacterium]|nr:hypothetical protein [Terriglobales bacterium]
MPEVNSPASGASPTTLAGMNPPSPQGGDDSSGRVPGGAGPGGNSEAQQGSQDAKLKTDVQALRGMEAALMEMAQSYPTATKALRSASEALRSAQRQIVSNPAQAEPPVPNTPA